MAPPKDVYILIPWTYEVPWQRGIKVVDEIKVADQLSLDGKSSWIIWVGPM